MVDGKCCKQRKSLGLVCQGELYISTLYLHLDDMMMVIAVFLCRRFIPSSDHLKCIGKLLSLREYTRFAETKGKKQNL